MLLKEHNFLLMNSTSKGNNIILRPMTENDWTIIEKWNSDSEVLYYSEGDDFQSHSPEEVREIYRYVSQNAICFIIEFDGKPIGECWLQKMNIGRILERYPDLDCRRIDIMIGEKDYWDKGIGTMAIKMLTQFGFETDKVDVIHIVGVADYNSRSLKAFQKAGYHIVSKQKENSNMKAQYTFDLALCKQDYFEIIGKKND